MYRTMAISAMNFAVHAFDGHREGFLLSTGLGGGQRTIEENISPSGTPNLTNPIKTTDPVTAYEVKIGYGLSNCLIVGLNFNNTNGTYTSILSETCRINRVFRYHEPGINLFFADRSPSLCVEAIFGMAGGSTMSMTVVIPLS